MEKIGNADKVLRKGDHYGRTLFYHHRKKGSCALIPNTVSKETAIITRNLMFVFIIVVILK